MSCPLCAGRSGSAEGDAARVWGGRGRATDMDHPALSAALAPARLLREEVRAAARQWLSVTGRARSAEELKPGGSFEGRPTDFAMSIYRFYRCYGCKRPYFGGERQCGADAGEALGGAAGSDGLTERICGGCAAARNGAACPKGHAAEFLQFKVGADKGI